MSDTSNLVAGTALVVVAGTWSKGDMLNMKVVTGGTVYLALITFMEQANSGIAKKFATLVFITALFVYAVPIFDKLGLVETKNRKRVKK